MTAFWKKKPSDPNELLKKARQMTANEFINVQDVRGSILYAKDGICQGWHIIHIFAYTADIA